MPISMVMNKYNKCTHTSSELFKGALEGCEKLLKESWKAGDFEEEGAEGRHSSRAVSSRFTNAIKSQ